MSQEKQIKHNVTIPSGQAKYFAGNHLISFLLKSVYKFQFLLSTAWRLSLFRFSSLPIRLKLSLILGAMVVFVFTLFSIIVLQNQKRVLKERMTQVCKVLILNLSESVYGDLIDGNYASIKESVFRLKKNEINGLMQVAVVDKTAKLVAAFGANINESKVKNISLLLRIKNEGVIEQEKPDQYEFFSAITMSAVEGSENNEDIVLGVIFISFSKSVIFAPLKNARDIALGSALFITLLAIVGIYLIAKKMVFQIHLIAKGAREVGQGNLDTIISVNSKDEIGQLAAEFNNMIRHLREKSQMQKFVSKLTVQMIKDTVSTSGQNSKAIKRNVAVLFSDVRNFSSIAEKLAPEEIVKLINIYFELQTKIIESHHGIVDKFMGDQIMSIFEGDSMADNALRAAVDIQKQIRMVNQERGALNQGTLEVGIGINDGAIVMGHMGSANRMDYTVIGDVVNVASRLCDKAKSGQIITSFELARKVNGSYPTTRLKSISVKGRKKSIKVCEVDYDRDILM